ncbi:MAG: META domain-containing protein [Hoeflea sp.]|uniref:META domain-containing protein n=1 Tax=Hoeflea sp. TaxID=1940281 RepID=UPI00329972F5
MKNLVRTLCALALLFTAQAVAKAEEILLQSVQSGLYVTAVNGTLAAAAREGKRASRFELVRLERNKIALRDVGSGSYVRAGVGQGTFLAAGSPHIRGWETFEVIDLNGRNVALRSVQNRKFIRAGVGSRSHLAAVSRRAAGWETFRLVDARNQGRTPGQSGGQNSGRRYGPDLTDILGSYAITHVSADNGFLVRLGGGIARQAQLSVAQGGTVRATVGCNSMSARISLRNGRVRTEGGVMATKMHCLGQGQSAAESGINHALTTSRFVVRQGRTVTFKAADGSELMKLRRR